MSKFLSALVEPSFLLTSLTIVIIAVVVITTYFSVRRFKRRTVRSARKVLSIAHDSLKSSPGPSRGMYLDPDTIKAAQVWAKSAVGYEGEEDGKINPDLISALIVAENFGDIPSQFENIVPKSGLVQSRSKDFTPTLEWLPRTDSWGHSVHPAK